jgi:hypothetical protein
MEIARDENDSLQSDLARIKVALRKLDLCESLERNAPHEAGRLLCEAQRELQRLIAALSPPDADISDAAFGIQDDVQQQMAELWTARGALLRAG